MSRNPLRVRMLPDDLWEVEGYAQPLTTRQMLAASWEHRFGANWDAPATREAGDAR